RFIFYLYNPLKFNTMNKIPATLISFLLLLVLSCNREPGRQIEILGVYGNPQPLWEKGQNLAELGANAVFVHSGSISHEMLQRAREEGLNVYAEFATLNGKGYVEKHPEAWAVNEKGEKVEAASWFMGVCPTEPGFREYRFGLLRELLTEFDIDGVWMDYVHWHAQFEEPEPILPETCFCDHCLASFSTDTGLEIQEGTTPEKARWILKNHDPEWRDWRCKVILDWVVEIRNIINEIKPGILLGIYHCPWTDEEFGGARRRILGLDYDLLRNFFDVFSPMVYHARMGREPGWVEENITWFCNRMDIEHGRFPKVWPIVQAYNNPYTVSASEFETVLNGGLTSKSTGVMMFTTRAVADDEKKLNVMKNFYLMQKTIQR
ncbi:MAG: family 10 glycosylhydrolase, partial [Mariniphaga sp.]